MPLQNRITPFGDIVARPGRGTLTGNRGIIHNAEKQIVRPWQVKRWIACALEFRGRKREVMQPNRWTHLFFLDEATAFSAGHRPCAECRNADYKRFRSLWESVHGTTAGADAIDNILHASRLQDRKKRTYMADITGLPDGTFIALEGEPWLVLGDTIHQWSDAGYFAHRGRPARGTVEVLTPEPIVAVFAAGYHPGVHVTARESDRYPGRRRPVPS